MSKVRADWCQVDTSGDKVVLSPFGGLLLEVWMKRDLRDDKGEQIK